MAVTNFNNHGVKPVVKERPVPNISGRAGEFAVRRLAELAQSDLPPWKQFIVGCDIVKQWRAGVATVGLPRRDRALLDV